MRTKPTTTDPHLRQRLAQASARIMVQESIDDFYWAKCKAASQLGVPHTKHLPTNEEIQAEILIYQRLFYGHTQPARLQHLRRVALQAMRLFAAFTPRLVGAVLNGTAHQHSHITLHLFSASPEDVSLFLLEKHIPYELGERRFRLASSQVVNYPSYRFVAGEETVTLIVFSTDDIRWSPPSPVDGKPMRRADLQTVEGLLES